MAPTTQPLMTQEHGGRAGGELLRSEPEPGWGEHEGGRLPGEGRAAGSAAALALRQGGAWELRGAVTRETGQGQGVQSLKEDLMFIPGRVETKGHAVVGLTVMCDKLGGSPPKEVPP